MAPRPEQWQTEVSPLFGCRKAAIDPLYRSRSGRLLAAGPFQSSPVPSPARIRSATRRGTELVYRYRTRGSAASCRETTLESQEVEEIERAVAIEICAEVASSEEVLKGQEVEEIEHPVVVQIS